jgi:hypothetical protein
MKKTFTLVTLSILILTLLTTGGATSNRVVPVPAPAVTPPCEDGVEKIADCPNTGCGELGDALLNQAKNRVDSITSGTAKTLDAIRAMPQPLHWDTGSPRTSIQGAGKEGTAVEVKGFLLRVKPEGGESCNCGLTRRVDTDVHFALVSDLDEPETESVTAEVTPRVRRDHHHDWLYRNLNDLEGEYVKVVGLLMLDTKHIPQAHRLTGERGNHGLTRATNWEIHPITRLWKCTKSKHACDHGQGWEEVP